MSYSSIHIGERSARDLSRASRPFPRSWEQPNSDVDLFGRPLARGVVAIASSTGGPDVLLAVLSKLPADFPYGVMIAQHIARGFAGGLVRWLQRATCLTVRLATGGEPIVPGVVYVSPTEQNLVVGRDRRTALALSRPEDYYHPSCDVLLASAASVYRDRCVGVILTGMGRDGADGIGAVKMAGGATFAQDEASSVVFGMNGAAVRSGNVRFVLSANEIGDEIVRFIARNPG